MGTGAAQHARKKDPSLSLDKGKKWVKYIKYQSPSYDFFPREVLFKGLGKVGHFNKS